MTTIVPKPKIKITETSVSTQQLMIYIKYTNDLTKTDNLTKSLISQFMRVINSMIGAKTTINYNMQKITNYTISIPIYIYTTEETLMKPIDVLHKRVSIIKTFLRNFNWDSINRVYLWLVRSLYNVGINISKSFSITALDKSTEETLINEPLPINLPKIEQPQIKNIKLNDNSIITLYIDPYIINYGLFVNLSVPFNDMGMSYNALHLYEHILTKPWKNLSGKYVIDFNGSTYPSGISYVYTLHSCYSSLMEYTNASIKWMFESRKSDFWNNIKDDLTLETIRTISETRNDRTLTSMGRSDWKAYDLNYNTGIFEYWANKPFNMLIVAPEMVKFDIDKLNGLVEKYRLNEVKRPENIVFDNIPFDVLITKSMMGMHSEKLKTSDIVEKLLKKDFSDECMFGIDCVMKYKYENVGVCNTVLHLLLFLVRFIDEETLMKFIRSNVIPYSVKMFSNMSLSQKYVMTFDDFEY